MKISFNIIVKFKDNSKPYYILTYSHLLPNLTVAFQLKLVLYSTKCEIVISKCNCTLLKSTFLIFTCKRFVKKSCFQFTVYNNLYYLLKFTRTTNCVKFILSSHL